MTKIVIILDYGWRWRSTHSTLRTPARLVTDTHQHSARGARLDLLSEVLRGLPEDQPGSSGGSGG